MKKYSSNTYSTSDGKRFTRAQIERKIRMAKADRVDMDIKNNGYLRCIDCGINSGYLDLSHNISVKECLEFGRAELAWSTDNIYIRCRKCHQKHDNTQLGWR